MSISRTEVKTQLGISNADYDTDIDNNIPIAEAKYRQIAGYDFNFPVFVTFNSGENTFTVGGLEYAIKYGDVFLNSYPSPNSEIFEINYGDIIEGTGIPAGTYITGIDKIENEVTVSANFTADGDRIKITTNIAYYPVISGMIWYMIGQQSTTAQDVKQISSKRVGPLAITYAPEEIDSLHGIPKKFVNAIPKYAGVY